MIQDLPCVPGSRNLRKSSPPPLTDAEQAKRQDDLLDEGLLETFPASDP